MKMSMFDDLNYPYAIEELYPGESGIMIRKATLLSIFPKLLKLSLSIVRQLNFFSKKYVIPKNIDTVIVICSLNQYRALEKLLPEISNALVISVFPVECEHNMVINTRGNCWLSLINAPGLIFNMLKRNGYNYKSMLFYFDDYLNAPGVYDHAFKYLKKIKPKSVLVANDHIFFPRSYFRAAQQLGITTIYTQHASVSSLFPPLEYDYSFLDGEETLDKYTANDRAHLSDVFLSGSSRFDKIPLIPDVNTYDLGLAINILDNQERILNFVKMLEANKINFIMRPHPGQPDINFWKQYCEKNRIAYSNPFEDSPITFISSSKCFVVGDSGLHLEVALCKKVSYYVNFQNNEVSDCYDFIKEGLVEAKSEEEVITILTHKEHSVIPVDKVKYYVANFETEYWGKSARLISTTINEINAGNSFTHWESYAGKEKVFKIKA